jgi:hypothetical protein
MPGANNTAADPPRADPEEKICCNDGIYAEWESGS